MGILEKIKDGDSKSLGVRNEEAWELVMAILNWLTGSGEHMISVPDCEKLYVPVEPISAWPTLVESRTVVYTDNDFLRRYVGASQSTEHSYKFVSQRVSAHLARQLRLTPLSQHLDIAEDAFEDVGQSEPLTVRLKNILKDYKDGLTIIKELLQNADDAGATELNICYDTRNHMVRTDSLLFPGMVGCHGPALVVHNNVMFTQEDFKNITKLAGATKEQQVLKIGKFGVGFCSVYHITDVPSFISDHYLYIFDPTLTYLKNEIRNPAQPGKRVYFTTSFFSRSQQLAPYIGLFGFEQEHQYEGTMFRFPFRTSPSDLSEKIYTADVVKQMFLDIKNCSSELLIFLQNINCITLSQISDGQREPTVQATIQKTTRPVGLVNVITITCTSPGSKDTSYWLVAAHTDTVLGQLATASVACSIHAHMSPFYLTPKPIEGEVFCFLPLSMKTGLPVHVSSNFAVSNNRTGIWTSDDSSKTVREVKWNETVMKVVIPKAYLTLLEGLKQMNVQEYVFFSLWPLKTHLRIQNPWNLLINTVYRYIESSTLFFSTCTGEWLSLNMSRFLSPDILSHSSSATLPKCVSEVVNCLKLPIVDLPQEYHAHMSLSQYMITEEVFLETFFRRMSEISPPQSRNEVLCLTLECFATELDETEKKRYLYLLSYLKSNTCIPTAPCGQLLRNCCKVVSPNAEFAALFEEKDGLFPIKSFCQKPLVYKAMEVLGMICSFLPVQMLIERAKTVRSLYVIDKCKALGRAKLILKYLNSNPISADTNDKDCETSVETIADIPFLPVMPNPKGYPLTWFGEGKTLLSGKELMLKGETQSFGDTKMNIHIAGSQVPFTYEVEPEDGGCGHMGYFARRSLRIRILPTLWEVIEHFKHLISQKVNSDEMIKECNAIAHQVYKYLEDRLIEQKSAAYGASKSANHDTGIDLSSLSLYPCIWTGKQFICCDKVAQEWKLKDGPYLHRVPDSLGKNLQEALQIKKKFTVDDLISALQQISNEYSSCKVPKNCQRLLQDIISELNAAEILKEHPLIMLPDNKFVMHEASSLAFNDAQWLKDEEGYTYVHQTLVTRDLALKLGVRMVRSKVLDKFRHKQKLWSSKRFGQRENLTSRIHNVLQDYPFDVTILKELLQNADDARATKMYVILDTRMHKCERVLSEHWKELQGPALLVWNDREFTEDDIEGIQKLGVGNKQLNPETIGQYGIGFNSIYHLTDCPSFITGDKIFCVFDPHCKYTPESTQEYPGERFDVGPEFWDKFPDMKPAYLCSNVEKCPNELLGGSLFRFPLRHSQELVDASEILGAKGGNENVLSAEKMHRHMKHWAPQMKQSLFFLNYVTEIKFFVITETNCLELERHYRVDIDKSAMAQRAELHEKITQFKNTNGAEPFLQKYQLSLVEVVGSKEEKERWLIQQGIGDVENRK